MVTGNGFGDGAADLSTERQRAHRHSWHSNAQKGTVPLFRLGEDVIHATLGEGVVTRIEADNVVVRFARDGSERTLIADCAPLTRC
jgi:DNA helicase-2/ATP-dependent DNA helicase PcrA